MFIKIIFFVYYNFMQKSFDLLKNLLNDIEEGLKDDLNSDTLADNYSLSTTHLRRLFQFAFNQPLGSYIRLRKLSSSIEDLLNTNLNILDIVILYGFEYEQTYIRSFKREFGITPGDLRKKGQIIKIKPPLHLFDSNRLADGAFFGPDIVMVPQFHVIGKKYKLHFRNYLSEPILYTHDFYDNYREKIEENIDTSLHINISTKVEANFNDKDIGYSYFMPSVHVKTIKNIPESCEAYTFPSALCARYNFIGPINTVINMAVADRMFMAIDNFMGDDQQKYFLERNRLNIDRFYKSAFDGNYSLWEWFSPVKIKNGNDKPLYPLGIIETYKQQIPALRFIGKKFIEPFNDNTYKKINTNLDIMRSNSEFDEIEKLSKADIKTIYKGSNFYTCLIRKKSEGLIEYLLGMFIQEKSNIQSDYEITDYEIIDFPKSELAVCSVYGKRDIIINYDKECRRKLENEKILKNDIDTGNWFLQRFNWNKFCGEDKFGNRILEYCYFI